MAIGAEQCILPSADVPCSYDRLLTVCHEIPYREENLFVLESKGYRRMIPKQF